MAQQGGGGTDDMSNTHRGMAHKYTCNQSHIVQHGKPGGAHVKRTQKKTRIKKTPQLGHLQQEVHLSILVALLLEHLPREVDRNDNDSHEHESIPPGHTQNQTQT